MSLVLIYICIYLFIYFFWGGGVGGLVYNDVLCYFTSILLKSVGMNILLFYVTFLTSNVSCEYMSDSMSQKG